MTAFHRFRNLIQFGCLIASSNAFMSVKIGRLQQIPQVSYSQHLATSSFQQKQHVKPSINTNPSSSSSSSSSKTTSTSTLNLSINDAITTTSSLFTTTSIVPLLPSFAINAFLFAALRSKLDKMLTPEGFFHSMALGTLLWHTLGWRGWTTCVLYLLFGQLVTKVKFQEKAAKGIAEGRGGRRGPENVW